MIDLMLTCEAVYGYLPYHLPTLGYGRVATDIDFCPWWRVRTCTRRGRSLEIVEYIEDCPIHQRRWKKERKLKSVHRLPTMTTTWQTPRFDSSPFLHDDGIQLTEGFIRAEGFTGTLSLNGGNGVAWWYQKENMDFDRLNPLSLFVRP
jgi:hypothetical protein